MGSRRRDVRRRWAWIWTKWVFFEHDFRSEINGFPVWKREGEDEAKRGKELMLEKGEGLKGIMREIALIDALW